MLSIAHLRESFLSPPHGKKAPHPKRGAFQATGHFVLMLAFTCVGLYAHRVRTFHQVDPVWLEKKGPSRPSLLTGALSVLQFVGGFLIYRKIKINFGDKSDRVSKTAVNDGHSARSWGDSKGEQLLPISQDFDDVPFRSQFTCKCGS